MEFIGSSRVHLERVRVTREQTHVSQLFPVPHTTAPCSAVWALLLQLPQSLVPCDIQCPISGVQDHGSPMHHQKCSQAPQSLACRCESATAPLKSCMLPEVCCCQKALESSQEQTVSQPKGPLCEVSAVFTGLKALFPWASSS